jgi:nitric oxide reductase subunit B
MRYRTQTVAYAYFVVALLLYGLQMVFGILSITKYLGPDPIKAFLPFDVSKEIHTNLLIVWVLTGSWAHLLAGARGNAERTPLAAPRLWQLGCGPRQGLPPSWATCSVDRGNKLLEQPMPVKLAIVVVMLMFLYNIGMTIWKVKRFTTTLGVLLAGLRSPPSSTFPRSSPSTTTLSASSTDGGRCTSGWRGCGRWCQGALLAYLLIDSPEPTGR